jgi:CRISPR-associated protein Csx10
VESWHTGWGLPRPSLAALQAGSCVVFEVQGTVEPERLRELQASGIGERTAEGYGQVCFNDLLLIRPANEFDPPMKPEKGSTIPEAPIPAGDPAHGFARLLEEEAWRGEIRRAALRVANTDRVSVLGPKPPRMSQLGSLRELLGVLGQPKDRRVLDWFEHLKKNARRSSQWQSTQQGVRNLLEDEGQVWRLLQDGKEWPTLTAEGKSKLPRDLWALAVRTLIDACIRVHKRATEKQTPAKREA